MKKLGIFDLDGTLLDTVLSIAYFCNLALSHYKLPVNEPQCYKYFAGNGAPLIVHRALAANGVDTEENFNKVFPFYMNAYDSDSTYLTAHFDGLFEVLSDLKEKGVRLAVVTNKPQSTADLVVPKFFGDGFFDYIYGSGTGLPLKPNPYSVNEIIQKCNVKKSEALYFGDTAVDMETGKNANLTTVGVLWGFRPKEELLSSGADIIIEKPSDIFGLFD